MLPVRLSFGCYSASRMGQTLVQNNPHSTTSQLGHNFGRDKTAGVTAASERAYASKQCSLGWQHTNVLDIVCNGTLMSSVVAEIVYAERSADLPLLAFVILIEGRDSTPMQCTVYESSHV